MIRRAQGIGGGARRVRSTVGQRRPEHGSPPGRLGAVAIAVAVVMVAGGCGSGSSTGADQRRSQYCARSAEIGALDVLADPAPDVVKRDLEQLLSLTRAAARVAPREILADARAAVRAQERFNAIYATHDWQPEPANLDPSFIALANGPTLAAVYLRLERYQNRRCEPASIPAPASVEPA